MFSRMIKIRKLIENQIFASIAIFNFLILTLFIFFTKIDRSGNLFVILLIFPLLTYAFTVLLLEKKKIKLENNNLKIFWAYNILMRILVIFIPVGLSDDIYRYVWDGQIQHHGINPYQYSPDNAYLDTYHTNWSSKINNQHINSPYPPFAQILFFVTTSFTKDIGLTIILIRVLIIGFDISTIIILKKILKHFSIPDRRIVIYAWSPLVIFEFAGNAHIDAIAVFFSLLAIFFILETVSDKYSLLSPIALSIAILTKVYPVILLPFLFLKWNLKKRILFFLSSLIFILPYLNNGINPLFPKGQQSFVRYFRFNESFFRLYRSFIEVFYNDADKIARNHYIIFMILFSGLLYIQHIYLASKTTSEMEINISIFNSFRYILLISLILAPDVQPWYIIWMLPLAALFYDWIIIILSMTVLLSYQIYPEFDKTGIWVENPIILFLEYSLVYFLLIYQIIFQSYLRNFSNIHIDKHS